MMNLELLAKSASQLFSLPEICIKLQELIYNPDSSMMEITNLISLDPSLSARLLKIANSSFYSFPHQIDSLQRAITLIGTQDLYNLALATSMPDTFNTLNENKLIDMNRYWRHSVMTGLIARKIADDQNLMHSESYFLTGLFHNLGKLVILEQMPEQYLEIKQSQDAETGPWEAENKVLGHTYAEVGLELLKCWQMPTNIRDMVEHQHQPATAMDPKSAAILHIASRAASQIEYQHLGFDFNKAITLNSWSLAKVNESQLPEIIELAQEHCQTMLSAMTGKAL